MPDDTIFALASGSTRAAIAVLRISGPDAGAAVSGLCRLPPPRQASVRRLRGENGAVLDQALVLWLPGPGTYTGEDSAELHLHGGRAVIEAVAAVLVVRGLRPADPGEFTRRAFLNGRMDLLEAEAVHDLIAAETEAQRRQALRQMDGALGAIYRDWADRLRGVLAYQEALIDFPDEDLPPDVEARLLATLGDIRREIAAHLDDRRRGEKLRDGLFFAITGAPNVGKSTLINALAGRDVAIVSPIPGTTRDVLETRIILGGVPVTLVDTAGLRETSDPIEAEGVRRARARLEDADLVLTLIEAKEAMSEPAPPGLLILTKVDLAPEASGGDIRISVVTGEGMATLRDRLSETARTMTESNGPPALTQARHRSALQDAAAHLEAAELADLPELRGEDLRLALRSLGRITGHVGVEDILDTVFSRFCIGK